MSGWYYMKTGMIQDEQVGPVADGAFLQLAFDGKIQPKTLVVHAMHTRGQWVQMEQIPAARTKYDEGARRQCIRSGSAGASNVATWDANTGV
jgi:hypothetical protein